jgi:hypothetical protein
MVIEDSLPIYDVFKPLSRVFNDFLLPFSNTLKAQYLLSYVSIDDYLYPKNILLRSQVNLQSIFSFNKSITANFTISEGNFQSFEFLILKKTIKATCEIV